MSQRQEENWEAVREFVHTEEKVYVDEESEWYFGQVVEEEGHIYGKFGRVITDSPVEYDHSRGEFVHRDGVQAENSIFVINTDRSVIIFNQRMRIGYNQFIRAFCEGFELYTDIELDIHLLKNKLDLDDVLAEGEINRANFQLFGGIYGVENFLIDHMRDLNAESVDITIESPKNENINIESELFHEALELCTSGYGDYALNVNTSNNQYRVTSFDKPATLELDINNNLGSIMEKSEDMKRFLNDWYHAHP